MDLSTAVSGMSGAATTGAPAASNGGSGSGNSNGNNNNGSSGTTACPVCTLYLREGISLERHLDTHPKEQVIEALIRASSRGAGPALASQVCSTPPTPAPQSMPPVSSTPQPPPASPSPHVPPHTQSPYPIGPIYECPPQINAMIPPPQFASFSYQQFVNNGTMMIPAQYAMAQAQAAPTSQMMQMLYSPYGMYHQQQIPTVQMISAPPPSPMMPTTTATLPQPATAVPVVTARVRPAAATAAPVITTSTTSVNENTSASVMTSVTTTTLSSAQQHHQLLPSSRPSICTPIEPQPDTGTQIQSSSSSPSSSSSSLSSTLSVRHQQSEPMEIEKSKEETAEKVVVNKGPSKFERILPDLEVPDSPELVQIEQEEEQNSKISAEHMGQQTQRCRSEQEEQSHVITEQYQRKDPPTSTSDVSSQHVTDDDKTERILPDIEDRYSIESLVAQETNLEESHDKDSEIMEVTESVEPMENVASKEDEEEVIENKFVGNKECNKITNKQSDCRIDDVQNAEEIIEPQNLSTDQSRTFDIEKSELDQINRLLGNMGSELSNINLSKTEDNEKSSVVEEEQNVTSSDLPEKHTDEDEMTNTIHEPIECKIIVAHEESDLSSVASSSSFEKCDMERDMQKVNAPSSVYHYKYSQSTPTSPVDKKKSYRSLSRASLRSDFDRSNENVCPYPVGFEATTLQDFLKDNYDGEDMELEEDEPQAHHSYLKQQSSGIVERTNLHATLSTNVSGVCELKSSRSHEQVSSTSVRSTTSSYCQIEEEDDESDADSCQSKEDLDDDDEEEEEDEEDDDEEEEEEDDEPMMSEEAPMRLIDDKEACKADIMRNELNSKVLLNNETTQQQQQAADFRSQSLITDRYSSSQFPIGHHSTPHQQQSSVAMHHENYPLSNSGTSQNLLNLSECVDPTTSTDSKSFNSSSTKSVVEKPSTELLNISEDAHAGPMNVFEFDGLQILVPSTFISESSQKAVSGTSQQSMSSSENGAGNDEEVKSVNMRADETMPARGELSEQESNGCTEQSAWQLYMGQESSRMSTSYDLMARESWEESEGSEHEDNNGGPLLDSRSLATHFTSSLFLDRDRKTPTRRTFKCSHCPEVFDCPKERRVHSTLVHKEAGPSSCSNDNIDQSEFKDIKLLEGRANVFEEIFVPNNLHVAQQVYQQHHHQQQSPLLHQLQPPQHHHHHLHHHPSSTKTETDTKITDALHLSTVTEVTCNLCNQRFSSEKSLQIHHRRMHVAEPIKRIRENAKCQICNEEFTSVANFNLHLKIHPLECGQCGKYFYRKQNFKLHMKRHLGIKPFPCSHCDKAFLTKQKLDEHTNGHTGNAPVKCNLCNETFRRYSNLTQHKNRHHLNIKKKLKDYICHCGEVFHTKKKLAWHKETHDEKPKACTYCNERFIHMASLTRHMRRAHNRRFVPDAQRENENVECPICKCIYLRSSLAVHMRVHNGERPYPCPVCSKTFSTKWNLQLHKWTHAARSTKPFKCNQCSAAFYRHSDYTAHMNSHRNVRPYTCNYCGAQFIRKYNCLRHVKEHEENKQYTCEICSKTFHRSYYLKEHLRVHSGQRPYTCHICGKSSSTKSNHNKHVRIHHAREPVNTEN